MSNFKFFIRKVSKDDVKALGVEEAQALKGGYVLCYEHTTKKGERLPDGSYHRRYLPMHVCYMPGFSKEAKKMIDEMAGPLAGSVKKYLKAAAAYNYFNQQTPPLNVPELQIPGKEVLGLADYRDSLRKHSGKPKDLMSHIFSDLDKHHSTWSSKAFAESCAGCTLIIIRDNIDRLLTQNMIRMIRGLGDALTTEVPDILLSTDLDRSQNVTIPDIPGRDGDYYNEEFFPPEGEEEASEEEEAEL